jgi:kynureninase
LLSQVAQTLKEEGIVVDQRQPDVVRVAPVPLYNSYSDVFGFVEKLKKSIGSFK